MALSTIRTQLQTLIGSVAGIEVANVHKFVRALHHFETFKSRFKSSGNKINAWIITRISTEERQHSLSNQNLRIHTMIISGYYGLKDADATEETFQDLVELVCAKLRENHTLNSNVLTCDPPQVEEVAHEFLGKYLLHSCSISLNVHEYITYTTS